MNEYIQYAIAGVSLGALYSLFALGIAVIFGIMRLVNFAHGELIMIGGYALVLLAGWSIAALLAATLLIVASSAVAMERTAFRPIRTASPATLLITSFALSYLLQSAASVVFGSLPKGVNISNVFYGSHDLAGVQVSRVDLITLVTVVALLGVLGVLLFRTGLGIQMRAAAEDFEMARLLGVKANTIVVAAFAISGGLAGIASVLYVAQTGVVDPLMGISPVLIAFAATIVGGMGSLFGAVLGGFLLGALTVAFQVALPLSLRSYRDAFVFLLVFAILVARPQGLIIARSQMTRI
jgi:branched-chain amino acid transport system permease protein